MRVVIAEDLFLLRDGLTRLLEAHGFEVAAAVDNAADLLRRRDRRTGRTWPSSTCGCRRRFTDEGLRAALEARREVPGLPVLVLSQYVEQLYARELLADGTGGIGYLLKDRVINSGQFVDAVRRVAAGGTAWIPRSSPGCWPAEQRRPLWPAHRPRARSARADGRRPVQRCHRRTAGRSPSTPSPSTSPTSSSSSACRPPTTTTAACWPCWLT